MTWRGPERRLGKCVLFREVEPPLREVAPARRFAFDGEGYLFRFASEALRIRLTHLFDPHVAVNASQIEPLPHQLTAVYGPFLDRQSLRFLLADDPGARKTVMAGLLIKELLIRGSLGFRHCEAMTDRLPLRLADMARQRNIAQSPPEVCAAALVVPTRPLRAKEAEGEALTGVADRPDPLTRTEVEAKAMQAVMERERALGFDPVDVSSEDCGYDIKSRDPASGRLRFIEDKGRHADIVSELRLSWARTLCDTGVTLRPALGAEVLEVP